MLEIEARMHGGPYDGSVQMIHKPMEMFVLPRKPVVSAILPQETVLDELLPNTVVYTRVRQNWWEGKDGKVKLISHYQFGGVGDKVRYDISNHVSGEILLSAPLDEIVAYMVRNLEHEASRNGRMIDPTTLLIWTEDEPQFFATRFRARTNSL